MTLVVAQPVELAPSTTDEVAAAFSRWWNAPEGFGKSRALNHERFDYQRCSVRFLEGWRDSESYASDFKRRGMPHENGERHTYMTARFLCAADRMSRRRAIERTFGEQHA